MLSKIRNLIVVPSLAALVLTTLVSSPVGATTSGRTGSSAPAAKARHCANGKPTRIFRDSRGDAEKGIDIDGLGVWNKDADRCYWTTVTGNFSKKRAQVIQVFYDTNRRRSGAEYQAWSYSPKDGDKRHGNYLLKLIGKHRYVSCSVYANWWLGKHEIGIGVPKSCMGGAVHIRVKVQLYDITKYRSGNRWRGKADYVPNHGWTPLF